ncbi:MAG: ATP-grasp domain-containing protein [Myxococcaceae bacterium]|nr:ATP-grasp domain-containing protein [Myxococcaceae bacterium]
MRNVLFAAPFPAEATLRFARAAASLQGVRLLGAVQEVPRGDDARIFGDVVTLKDGLDARQLIEAAKLLEHRHGKLHRVLGILEPLQVQLGEVRTALGVPGTSAATADLFRDKARMKDELRKHGLPTARHRLLTRWSEAEAFAAEVGFPIVVKPPAGMGCKATWRVKDLEELRQALVASGASEERPALAEEFMRGAEHSFDTITVGGEVRFHSISRYFPTPLEVMDTPWVQWVVVFPRDITGPEFAEARAMGIKAVKQLGLETGFTHMEWFRRDNGSLAIGEIAARPPGAHFMQANSHVYGTDMYRAWARAVIDDAFDGPFERKYAVGVAYLRGMGRGRVAAISGVDRANALVGRHVVESRLPTIGAPRSDSYEGDGYVIARDPDVEVVKAAMKVVIETVRVECR